MDWEYDQFQEPFLDTVCDLLDRHNTGNLNRSDLVSVIRVLCAQANARGDDGVLYCKWGDDFSDGKSPGFWSSSHSIIDRYNRWGEPVKYGQCWVMAGLVTGIMRCIGIPTRNVTCYDAGYDLDDTLLKL